MDILGQFQKKFKNVGQKKSLDSGNLDIPDEYGAITKMVMKFSGGRIRDPEQASRVLLAAVLVMLAFIAFYFLS